MLKTVKIAGLVIVALIVVVLSVAVTRPDRFQVQRSVTIQASADRIYPLIEDLRRLNTWNPFVTKDPDSKGTYSGPARGKGAGYAFEGGSGGSGRIEIVDSTPPSRVAMRLTMIKPLAADNDIAFILDPQGNATRVTWAMDGQVPFIGKVLHMFVDMDRMVGREFEAGLADLKAQAEKSASASR
jgi:Polyketide cyclase / dehydrase and lipid transport